MRITQSVTIKTGTYILESVKLADPIMTITGDNIVVDFNGSTLIGSKDLQQPDLFKGLGILIEEGKNIQIKNATVKGFKAGLMGWKVDSLQILSSDFSHNHRQRLKSTPELEDLDDWLTHFTGNVTAWPRDILGTGVYLNACDHALVKDVTINEGQNGLILIDCDQGMFYNNNMQFNSSVGIGLCRSRNNQIMHNKLDWCIRGYSHGIYNRGQNAAGILLSDSSSKNTIAFNSVTHAGDGFSVWPRDEYLTKGMGSPELNVVYNNDFSHASNNGVKATFGSSNIVNNDIRDCYYGIWGGYSIKSLIVGNRLDKNIHDIAIEHGSNHKIYGNVLQNSDIGIQLWERPVQPKEWTFVKNRSIQSYAYEIRDNLFTKVKEPLKIEDSEVVFINDNQFAEFQRLLKSSKTNEDLVFENNTIYQNDLFGDAYPFRNDNSIKNGEQIRPIAQDEFIKEFAVQPLPDGQNANLPEHQLRGRKYMLITEWGPYNFQYPSVWLRRIEGDKYTFALFGPEGNWKVVGGMGFTSFSRKSGAMPATLVATKGGADKPHLSIELEFIGTSFKDQLGNEFEKGRVYPFRYFID